MLRRVRRGVPVPGPRSVAGRLAEFAPFFADPLVGEGGAGTSGAVGDHPLVDEGEDKAGGAGNHQDQADGVDADALYVEVRRVAQDRADGNQEYRSSDAHVTPLPTERSIETATHQASSQPLAPQPRIALPAMFFSRALSR